MASLNKWTGIGNLGADPEIRYMPNGDAVANFRIATSESWKDKQTGEKRESTEWHTLVAFRRLAEIIGEYAKKGSQIYVEGRLKTETWEKDGQKHYSTKVYVDVMKILGGRRDGESGQRSEITPAQNQQRSGPTPQSEGSFSDFEDDAPF